MKKRIKKLLTFLLCGMSVFNLVASGASAALSSKTKEALKNIKGKQLYTITNESKTMLRVYYKLDSLSSDIIVLKSLNEKKPTEPATALTDFILCQIGVSDCELQAVTGDDSKKYKDLKHDHITKSHNISIRKNKSTLELYGPLLLIEHGETAFRPSPENIAILDAIADSVTSEKDVYTKKLYPTNSQCAPAVIPYQNLFPPSLPFPLNPAAPTSLPTQHQLPELLGPAGNQGLALAPPNAPMQSTASFLPTLASALPPPPAPAPKSRTNKLLAATGASGLSGTALLLLALKKHLAIKALDRKKQSTGLTRAEQETLGSLKKWRLFSGISGASLLALALGLYAKSRV